MKQNNWIWDFIWILVTMYFILFSVISIYYIKDIDYNKCSTNYFMACLCIFTTILYVIIGISMICCHYDYNTYVIFVVVISYLIMVGLSTKIVHTECPKPVSNILFVEFYFPVTTLVFILISGIIIEMVIYMGGRNNKIKQDISVI